MPSNTVLNSGTGGDTSLTRQVSHDGDTVKLQGVELFQTSGTEDAYTLTQIGTIANPLRTAAGTQFAEDVPHTSGDLGAVALGVRRDADTTPVSLDGDYHTLLFDATGNLKVNVKQGAAGGVTHTDDAAFTPAVDDVVPIAGFFDDVTPDSVDEGDAGAVRMSANRNLYTRIRDNAGNERGANVTAANELNVLASAQPGVDIGDVTVNNAAGASAVNVQDGGNSITIDGTITANAGTGTFTVDQADTAVADYDTGAGTVNQTMFGVALPASGGPVAGGTSTNPIRTDPTGTTTQPVSGTVTANAGTGTFTVASNKSSNGGVPGATNLGVLGGVATAASPAQTEGNQVSLSTNLSGELRVTGGGGGTQFAEDAPHTSGDQGTVALGVRRDADTTPVSLDGDYHTLLFDATGNLKVNVKQGAAGGVTHTDDAAFTIAVDDVVPAAGLFDDVTPDLVDEGDAGVIRMSANRNLYTRIRDNAGNERGANVTASSELNVLASAQPGVDIGDVTVNNAAGASAVNIQDGGNSLTVDGTVTANAGTGTFIVDQTDTAAADYDTGAGTVNQTMLGLALPAAGGPVAGGTSSNPVRTDPTGTTTQPVSGTVTSNAGTGNFTVVGAKSSNGGVPGATNLGTLPAIATAAAPAYTEGNQVGLSTDLAGAIRTIGGAGGTQFAEDAVHTSGDLGTVALGVRRDADTTPVSADGDYHTLLFDATGNLKVNIKAGGGTGGTAIADESAFTEGTTSFTPVGGVLNDTITSDPTEDQGAAFRITAKRGLHVNLRNADGTERGISLEATQVDVRTAVQKLDNIAHAGADIALSEHVPISGQFDDVATTAVTENNLAPVRITSGRALHVAQQGAIPAGTNNIGDVDVLTLPALVAGTANIGDVDIVSFAAGAITEVQGDVAHDAVVAGNPVLIGFEARDADGTPVASADAVRGIADTLGKPIVLVGSSPNNNVNGRVNLTTATAADVIAAQGAGKRTVVMGYSITNAHATVNTKVELRDGVTVKVIDFAQSGGGGVSRQGATPIFIGTGNTAITARAVTTGADIEVNVSGYAIVN